MNVVGDMGAGECTGEHSQGKDNEDFCKRGHLSECEGESGLSVG